MKLWIITLVTGACLTIGAGVLQAQPADGPGGPGGRMQRKGPADGDRDRNRDQDRSQDRSQDRNQDRQGPGGPGGPRPAGMHFGPLMHILDTDKDGVLSAAEIAAASASLLKLDKNGDGKIDRVELLPPRPQGPRDGQGPRAGQGQQAGQGPRDGQGPRAGQGPRDGQGPRGDAGSDGPRPGPRGQRPGNRQPQTPPAASQE